MTNNLKTKMIEISTNKIMLKVKINKEQIKRVNILIPKFKLDSITEKDLTALKNHLMWCHKELLEMYNQYEKIINTTKKAIETFGQKKKPIKK